jgi:hypothetical protein
MLDVGIGWLSSFWGVIAGAGVGTILGFLAGATSGAFFRVLLTNRKRPRRRKGRDKEQLLRRELEDVRKQIKNLEAEGVDESDIEALRPTTSADLVSRILLYFAIFGGLIGLTVGLRAFYQSIIEIVHGSQNHGFLDIFVTTAYAADDVKSALAPYIPFIAMGILAIMGLSFIVALVVLLIVPDTKENQARIKSADNIVKTFGGFFTGLATTLLR